MRARLLVEAAAALLAATSALAQQPPAALLPVPLSDQPYVFDTAEVHPITVTVVAHGFARPFAMEFLHNGDLLVAERSGNLRIIRRATAPGASMDAQPIAGMPLPGTTQGNFGLHDIAVHPNFAINGLIYWTWNIPVPNTANPAEPPEQGRFSIQRGRLADGPLTQIETIFEAADPSYPAGTRLAFAPDGTLLATTSGPFGQESQDLASPYGKVLRLNDDGTIPSDNPFTGDYDGRGAVNPAVFSYGHRDQHGLVITRDGSVLSAEHGPNGGDELNLIRPGANYGWPLVTLGRNYDGTDMPAPMQADGITDPLVVWLPSIAPSGLLVYSGDAFPSWRGNVFIGSARRGEIAGTGGLERVVFTPEWGELRRETLLTTLHQRVRDAVQGPDGLIYVLTDGPENAVLRIAPAPAQ